MPCFLQRWSWSPGRISLGTAASCDLADVRDRQPAARGRGSASQRRSAINVGKARYAWVTLLPLAFVSIITLTAGVLGVRDNFWPMAIGPNLALDFQGYLNTALTVIAMTCVVVILANALWKWMQVLGGRRPLLRPPPKATEETQKNTERNTGVVLLCSSVFFCSWPVAEALHTMVWGRWLEIHHHPPPVALRAADGHNERRHEARRHGRRFGTRDRRRGERRKQALRSLLLAAATMSASHVSLKSARSSMPELIPSVSVEMGNFIPIRPENAYDELIKEAAGLHRLDPALIRAVMSQGPRSIPRRSPRWGRWG